MFEWTIFYRLLQLPDDVATPTYYHLLGLNPNSCTGPAVQEALQERKKRLRQNIPGPHFIPLVLRFESEQLEPAAEVLADPKKRADYNEYLKTQAKQGNADWLKAERALVIKKARKVVVEHINDDGALDEEQRPVLAQKLIRLGFSQGDVRVLFEGIPTPSTQTAPSTEQEREFFTNAVELAITGNGLSDDDLSRLINLAEHLGMTQQNARDLIKKQLAQTKDHPPEAGSGQCQIENNAPPTDPFPTADAGEDSQVYVVTEIIKTEESAPLAVVQIPAPTLAETTAQTPNRLTYPKSRPKKLRYQILKIIVPLFVSGGFIGFLIYNLNNPIVPKAARQTKPPSDTTQFIDDTSSSQKESKNNTLPMTPSPPSSLPDTIQADSFTPSEIVKRIRLSYSSTGAKDQVLTDLAVTMLACREYAHSFVRNQPVSLPGINRIVNAKDHPERADMLIEKVQLAVDFSKAKKSADRSDSEWLKTLEKMLAPDKPKSVQYRAIEELAVDGSARAADILINVLESNRKIDEAMVPRILRALENKNDPQVPLRLADLLENPPHRSFVHPLLLTLITLSGRSDSILNQPEAILPFLHTGNRRKECAQWWREYFTQRHPYITKNLSTPPTAGFNPGYPTPSASHGPRQQEIMPLDAKVLKLTALIAHYADSTAEALGQFDRNEKTPPLTDFDDSQTLYVKENIARQLRNSLDKLIDAHFRLVRSHPQAKTFARKIDTIEIQNQTNSLLSESKLQQMSVHLETTGRILEILIKEWDENGQYPVILNQIRLQKQSNLTDSAATVRESAYFNLLLWDFLVSLGAGPPADAI